MPNELLRGPGTGCGRRSDSGGGSVQWLNAWSMRIFSALTRARSAADRLTWRGATLSDWLAYCLLPTENSISCLPSAPRTITCRGPSGADSGMPITATQFESS